MPRSDYSVLKLFTGFAIAAFIAWKLMVNNAMAIAIIPATETSTIQYLFDSKILQPVIDEIISHRNGNYKRYGKLASMVVPMCKGFLNKTFRE